MIRFGIVVFPGSNCDHDAYHVVSKVIRQEAVYLWHESTDLQGCDVILLPGGFAYGDYLRTGALAKFSPIMAVVKRHAFEGGLLLGICNGFQILLEAGLLPGAMLRNRGLKFVCKHVLLRVEDASTPFTCICRTGQILRIPVAHNEGNYYADETTLRDLESHNQVVLRYCNTSGQITDSANPNGSLNNIAGIRNRDGNVLGLMPHPERASEEAVGSVDGRILFESLCASVLSVAR